MSLMSTVGVWLGGRSVWNSTRETFIWSPQNYIIEETYWEGNQLTHMKQNKRLFTFYTL